MLPLSVIVCTYNPDPAIFSRCLKHLEKACEIYTDLEVLIIDNNSTPPVSELDSVQALARKYSFVKVIQEAEQGLTPARLRGIREATGQLLVFVDDDNFISENFLLEAARVAETYPFIGAFSGQVRVISNNTPAAWTKKYWGMLVHREFEGNAWSNLLFNNETMPCGAGLCVHRKVARYYLSLHEQGKRSFQLDRSKNSLLSGGDNDLAMCAIDSGMGMGLFDSLSVEHFIPESRFTLGYLSKLAYGIYYSYVILKYYRTGQIENLSSKRKKLMQLRYLLKKREDRIINKALQKGMEDAALFLKKQHN